MWGGLSVPLADNGVLLLGGWVFLWKEITGEMMILKSAGQKQWTIRTPTHITFCTCTDWNSCWATWIQQSLSLRNTLKDYIYSGMSTGLKKLRETVNLLWYPHVAFWMFLSRFEWASQVSKCTCTAHQHTHCLCIPSHFITFDMMRPFFKELWILSCPTSFQVSKSR